MKSHLKKAALKIQSELLELAESEWDIGPTDLARQMGISASSARAWRCETDGFRSMPVFALVHLARIRRDPIRVFARLLAEFGLVAVRHHETAETEATDVVTMMMRTTASNGRLAAQVAAAVADGEIDSSERADMSEAVRHQIDELQSLLAQLEDVPESNLLAVPVGK